MGATGWKCSSKKDDMSAMSGANSFQKAMLLLGDINVDISMQVETLPAAGEDRQAQSLHLSPGGAVVNSAVVLDRLGQPCALLSHTGSDMLGEQVMSQLSQKTGIDLQYVRRTARVHSGVIFVAVTGDGERSMYSYRGANLELAPEHLPLEAIQKAALLHLSGYGVLQAPHSQALWKAVELAQAAGVPVSLDTGLDPALAAPQEMHRLMACCSVVVLGMREAQALFGVGTPQEALQALFACGTGMRLAAVKLGKAGCALSDGTRYFESAPFTVRAVDATGAGDAFSAGLLFGWLRGWQLESIGTLANALGALATLARGGGTNLPGRAELQAFLERPPGARAADLLILLQE